VVMFLFKIILEDCYSPLPKMVLSGGSGTLKRMGLVRVVRSQGVYPWRGYWDTGPREASSFLHHMFLPC
jgi:hypothetical protein